MMKSNVITNVVGLDLTPLDEDYDVDALAFFRAPRIYKVKVIENLLEIKYTNRRERNMNVGSWAYFPLYNLDIIMALLNYEEKDEIVWKIEIAIYLKMQIDYSERLKKENEEKLRKMQEKFEEMEVRANKLREKGICQI